MPPTEREQEELAGLSSAWSPGLIIIIIIITGQGDLRLAPTSPVQAKIQ